MKKYSSYKPSGEDYIGDIPNEWECVRLGMLGVFSSSGIDKKTNDNETSVRMVNYTDIIQNRKYNPIQTGKKEYMVVSTPLSKLNEHRLIKGDMVFIPSSETKEDLGYSSLIDFDENDIVYSYHILRYRTHKNIYHYFKKYLINHHSVLNQFSRESKGTTRQIIGRNVFNNVKVVLPKLEEQEQIVNYLDEKTTLIDKLISTKLKKVELLKEQRTSLINQVITKGLNHDVKMKDSGLEWIGEIPESWSVIKLKSLVECNKKVLPENTNPDYELKYIEIGDVNSLGEIKGMSDYLFKNSPSRCRRILSKGDIFISSVRTYLKSIGYVENEISDIICSTGFCVLSPKSDVISKYLFYQVLTEFFISEVISKSVGVSYPSITSTELINIKVIKPSIVEQEQIVEYLDKHTKEIDDLVSMEQNKIELLKEYRQSLISEVITGKIKVV